MEVKAPIQNERVISDFEKELEQLINKHSRENMSDTPDFILAEYLNTCLTAYSVAVSSRDHWLTINKQEA